MGTDRDPSAAERLVELVEFIASGFEAGRFLYVSPVSDGTPRRFGTDGLRAALDDFKTEQDLGRVD